jgi:curved DNA-binding protein CbpA
MDDVYRVLQVQEEAEDAVIQAAYRALARIYHPDGLTPDPGRMAALNEAYELVRDPARRRAYDARRRMTRAHAVPIVNVPQRVHAGAPHPGDAVTHRVLDFGRYAGWSIGDLARHDPDYLRWLCRHSSGLRFRDAIVRVLPREPDLERRANSVA